MGWFIPLLIVGGLAALTGVGYFWGSSNAYQDVAANSQTYDYNPPTSMGLGSWLTIAAVVAGAYLIFKK